MCRSHDTHRRRIVAALLLALIGGLIGVVPAWATWRSPVYVSGQADGAVAADVAVDPGGDAVVTWLDAASGQLHARVHQLTGGRQGAILDVSAPGQVARSPKVVVAANGRTVFTWKTRRERGATRLQARARSASGHLGPIVDIATAVAALPPTSVAIDAHGNAIVAWTTVRGNATEALARSWSTHGELGPITSVSGTDVAAHDPQVAIAAGGNALIVWTAPGADGKSRAWARPWSSSPAVAPGPAFVVSQGRDGGYDAQVAMNSNGDAILAWTAPDGDRAEQYLHARSRSAAGKLGPDRTMRVGDAHATIAIAANRSAFFAAYDQLDPDYPIRTQTLTAAGRITPVRTLQTGDHTVRVSIAADAKGNALLAWRRYIGHDSRVVARTLSAAGTLGAQTEISPSGSDARTPRVAMTPGGRAVVTWISGSAANARRVVLTTRR